MAECQLKLYPTVDSVSVVLKLCAMTQYLV
jgi:hypothetical protein